jgi:hypothetical protein
VCPMGKQSPLSKIQLFQQKTATISCSQYFYKSIIPIHSLFPLRGGSIIQVLYTTQSPTRQSPFSNNKYANKSIITIPPECLCEEAQLRKTNTQPNRRRGTCPTRVQSPLSKIQLSNKKNSPD